MAKLYAGRNNVIPVRDIASKHWGDIIGEIDNQEDLKEALDSKVEKTSSPNSLYGTDSNGNPAVYDTSSLFSTESCPDGYTEVEYISSTEPTPWIDEVSSSITVRINSLASMKGKMDQASSMFEVYMCKMKAVMTSTSDTWNVYMYDSEENEYLFNEGVTTSSITSMYGLAISWNSWTEGSYFTGIREGEGGQYIDTGIQINNYPDGRCGWDSTKSVKTDLTLYPSISEDKYATYLTYCRQMSNYYQTTITKIKAYVSESGTQSGGCVEIYPDEEEYETNTPYGYFYDYNNLHNSTGIYVSAWTRLVQGDTLYFWGEEPTTETVGYETSVKANQSFINAPNNTYIGLNILGSMEQSNWAGCAILAAVGDGVGYKHYDLYVGSSISFAYKTGVWNNISLHPGLFTCNGESYVPTFASKNIRTVPGVNIILFGISRGRGYPINTSGCSMKTTKIYKNGNVVFCGIPCIQDSTGIAGMYDTVSDTFFSSAKEGVEFIAGPVAGAKSISLGVENPSSILGLGLDNSIQAYKGKNGIVLNAIMETEDYEELEYLESTDGNAAINTGITFETESWRAWEVTYALGKTSAGLNSGNINYCQYIMGDGVFDDIGQNYYRTTVGFFDGRARFNYSSVSNRCNFIYDYVREDLNRFHTLTYTNKKLYVDGKLTANIDPAQVLVAHSKPMHLFCSVGIYNSGFEGGFIGKISRCRYYYNADSDGYLANSRVIMNDFVPVRRKSDGELGFFDKITGRFCPNINTAGVLVAGPVKTSTIELKYDIDEFVRNVAIDNQSSIIISNTVNSQGYQTSIDVNSTESTVVGYNSFITNDSDYVTLVGSAGARGNNSVAVGYASETGANSVAIGYGANRASATTYGQQQSVTIGANAQTLDYGVAIGYKAQVLNNSSIAIGHNTIVQGQYSVGIGIDNATDNSRKVGLSSVVIGYNAMGNTANDVVIIGRNASVNNCQQAVVIGSYAQSVGIYGVSIGKSAGVYGPSGIALGYQTIAQEEAIAIGAPTMGDSNYTIAQQGSVVIGSRARTNVGGTYSVVIGYNSQNNGYQYSTVIGQQSRATGGSAVAVGSNTQAGEFSTALGYNATANSGSSIAIGKQGEASGSESISIGNISQASGIYGISMGAGSKANGSVGNIAIGHNAKATNRNWNVAIGGSSIASADYSVALGSSAEVTADYAIQLGAGTNDETYTLQFRDYKLVDADGHIPYDRLSEDTPTSGYVLSYDGNNDCLTWTENGQGGGGYVLPIASATTLGGIKVGDGLQINSSTGVLSVTGGGTGGGDGIWGQIEGDINDQTDLMNILNSKFTQTQAMPKASSEYSGKTLQYLGLTDLLYTHGYVYECEYKRISKLTGTSSDDSRFLVSTEVERFEAYFKAYIPNYELVEDTYTLSYNQSEGSWFLYDSNEELVEEISTANLQYMGINLSYIGQNEPEDGDIATLDYIPATDEQQAPFGYIWEEMYVQPSYEVINNTSSWSETDALSANQGRLLQEQIDSISAIGTFLAIWDANKQGNNARYLTDGYEYTRGNYFIVGAVDSRTEASGDYSSHTSAGAIMTSTNKTEPVEYYQAETDETHTITWNATKQKWVDELGNEFTHSMTNNDGTWIVLGFLITSGSSILPANQLVDGDYVTINIVFPHNYMPTGASYDITAAGCERTMDDVQISDMYFYDGTQWILLANHSKSIAIDSTILPYSKNPAENRAIYSALDGKVTKVRQANILYGTTAGRETGAITVGTGLDLTDGTLTADLSSKQDVLVSGENIKTINGESLLGSGNIVIQGGGSSDAMGTINIASLDGRAAGVEYPERDILRDEYRYKGSFNDICFTTNADIDYIKEHQNDLYFTFSRRSTKSKTYNVIDDHRYDTDVKVHCWRVPTRSYYNKYEWRWLSYDDILSRDNISDIDYTYFYTLEDYGDDVADLVEANPYIYIAPLSNQSQDSEWVDHDVGFEYGGNWTTNFNQLEIADIGKGEMTLSQMYRWVEKEGYTLDEVIERVPVFDITKIANPNNEFLNKMRGRLYTNEAGEKVYCYAVQEDWYDNAGQIYAPLDNEDEVILNYVPSDKREIRAWLTTAQLESAGWTLSEVRNDLTYYRLNVSHTSANVADMISDARSAMTAEQDAAGDNDRGWGRYYFDNPICPTRFSECKFVITKVPYEKVWNEEGGYYEYPSDAYSDYMNQAYTLKEIEEDETLSELFAMQEQIMIVPNWDSYNLWMRMLGWESSVYSHRHSQNPKEADEPLTKPVYGYDELDNWIWLTDEQTGEPLYEPYQLWAESYERHDLINALWKSGGITNHSEWQTEYGNATDFNDATGSRSGISSAPKWNCSGCHKYWMPVQFNIMTGKDLTYGMKSKSTPVSKKLTIIGNGASYIF